MKRLILVGIHLGYWGMYVLLLSIMFLLTTLASQDPVLTSNGLGIKIWFRAMLPLAIAPGLIGFYGSYLWLFPHFFLKKKFGKFILGSLGVMTVSVLVSLPIVLLIIPKTSEPNYDWDGFFFMGIIMFLMATINLIIGTVIKGFITSFHDIHIKEALTRQTSELEMQLVRSQLSPHFLFNTLNNIDVLIQRDPPKASEYLIKLSEILRFMLYEAKDELRPLSQEIDHITRYVELQRIRTNVEHYVDLRTTGNINRAQVMPLVFLPFIENAFKYAEHKKEAGSIAIAWQVDEKEITFTCSNLFDISHQNHHAKNEGGLGNDLIKKRLQLLYPDSHELTMEEKDHRFFVTLKLPLE